MTFEELLEWRDRIPGRGIEVMHKPKDQVFCRVSEEVENGNYYGTALADSHSEAYVSAIRDLESHRRLEPNSE